MPEFLKPVLSVFLCHGLFILINDVTISVLAMEQLITQSDPDIGIHSHLSTFGEHAADVFNGCIAPLSHQA